MKLKPKYELFCKSVIKHQGHLSNAYQEIYNSSPETARHGGSYLWRKMEIKIRLVELMERKGIGLEAVIEKLKGFMYAQKYQINGKGERVPYGDNIVVQMEGIDRILRLYIALLKSGAVISIAPDQVAQIEYIVKKSDEMNQEKQDIT